ncbi:MAG: hypothetical protein P1U77_19110 [Rubripirellula sp.]|nr:hypothetical protein [Rubripirellula sp.]
MTAAFGAAQRVTRGETNDWLAMHKAVMEWGHPGGRAAACNGMTEAAV